MLTSISIILLFGLLAGTIFNKMKLPSLIGYVKRVECEELEFYEWKDDLYEWLQNFKRFNQI